MLGSVGEVRDGGLTGSEPVGADEGHRDLHGRPAGDGTSVADAADQGRGAHGLVEGLADGVLQLLGLLLGELLVDVDHEALVKLADELVVSAEDLDVAVLGQRGADLGHVLLNDRTARHGVVHGLQVQVDGLRGDLLAQPLLDNAVGGVETDDDGPADIIPRLLHGGVVHEVQVVSLGVDVRVGQLVRHEDTLAERNANVLVHHWDATLLGDLVGLLYPLLLPLGLLPATKGVVVGVDLGRVLLELLLHRVNEELIL